MYYINQNRQIQNVYIPYLPFRPQDMTKVLKPLHYHGGPSEQLVGHLKKSNYLNYSIYNTFNLFTNYVILLVVYLYVLRYFDA